MDAGSQEVIEIFTFSARNEFSISNNVNKLFYKFKLELREILDMFATFHFQVKLCLISLKYIYAFI